MSNDNIKDETNVTEDVVDNVIEKEDVVDNEDSTKVEEKGSDSKVFTQDEVDEIVKKRLAKEKKKVVKNNTAATPENKADTNPDEIDALLERLAKLEDVITSVDNEKKLNDFKSKLETAKIDPSLIDVMMATISVDKIDEVDIDKLPKTIKQSLDGAKEGEDVDDTKPKSVYELALETYK